MVARQDGVAERMRRHRRVQRLVDEPVGELVVRALHVPILDAAELARKPARLDEELAQRLVLDAVLAAHLLDHQLRVGDDLDRPARCSSSALRSPAISPLYSATLFVATPIASPSAASTVPSSSSSTKP